MRLDVDVRVSAIIAKRELHKGIGLRFHLERIPPFVEFIFIEANNGLGGLMLFGCVLVEEGFGFLADLSRTACNRNLKADLAEAINMADVAALDQIGER